MMKQKIVLMCLVLVLSIPSSVELFKAGGFTSHDLTHHVVRQIAMDKILHQGQFPPRWVDYLFFGYGYPLFIFNYPLPPLIGEIFHLGGLNYLDSTKAVLILSLFLSSLGMYLFLSELVGPWPAILGSLTYLYAPVRFLNVYVSAALGSALGMSILPWVFLFLVRIKKAPNILNMATGGITLALLILAHNVTTLIFGVPIFVFALLQFKFSQYNFQVGKKLIGMFLLGFGLSAFFWLPSVLEKSVIRYDSILRYAHQNQFPRLIDLIRSPWGYGLSHPGQPGGISYEIGIAQLLILVILIFIQVRRKIQGEKAWYGFYLLIFFLLSILLMLSISQPLWDSLPFLYLIQFPSRFLALSVFTASLAAALALEKLPAQKILFVFGLLLLLYASRNHWHINQVYNPGENYYLSQNYTSTTYDEHLPILVKNIPIKPTSAKFEFLSGNGGIKILSDKANYTHAIIEATQSSKIQFNQIYFPGWKLDISPPVDVSYFDERGYDLPTFNLAQGRYEVKAAFVEDGIRNLADKISLACLITLIMIIFWQIYLKSPVN